MARFINFFRTLLGFAQWCTVHYNDAEFTFATYEEARDYYRNLCAGDHSNRIEITDARGELLQYRVAR